jgi:Uma2 family endonuclease
VAVAITTGITIEEFEQLPEALARNRELVNGELVDVSGNTAYHNSLRDLLVELLGPYAAACKLGKIIAEQEFDFDGNAHGPDVSLIGPGKLHLVEGRRRVQRFVPDLAIEIVSENDRYKTLMEKAARYRRCGTQEVWVLSPDNRQASVLSDARQAILGDDQMFESPLIPGFSIRLGDLFDRAAW